MRCFFYLCIVVILLMSACSDNDNEPLLLSVSTEDEGVWIDLRDNCTYRWGQYGNLEWMCENMHAPQTVGAVILGSEVEIGTEGHAWCRMITFIPGDDTNG